MLIIEVCNGNVWRLAGRVQPGAALRMFLWRSRDDTDVLRFEVEWDRTLITIAGSSTVIELRAGSEPWEQVMHARWMRAPMLCRLRHRPEPIRFAAANAYATGHP